MNYRLVRWINLFIQRVCYNPYTGWIVPSFIFNYIIKLEISIINNARSVRPLIKLFEEEAWDFPTSAVESLYCRTIQELREGRLTPNEAGDAIQWILTCAHYNGLELSCEELPAPLKKECQILKQNLILEERHYFDLK